MHKDLLAVFKQADATGDLRQAWEDEEEPTSFKNAQRAYAQYLKDKAARSAEKNSSSYDLNSRSEENFIRNTSIFGAWNTAYSMEYVEYGWNTGGIQASGRSFGIRGKRIHRVGSLCAA